MPTWQRHVTGTTGGGGFWPSQPQDVYADNCSAKDKTDIENAHNSLIARAGINLIPMLRDDMASEWAGIPINCCFDNTRPTGGDLVAPIFICNMNGHQIEVELCRGLVSLASGQKNASDAQVTLDVKAMQFACFGAPDGAPTSAQFNDMVNAPHFSGNTNEFEGQYVIWNRSTGEVWPKITTTTGGFWTGSTVSSKGSRAFIDAAWQF
jgi:hypothetical protein